MSPTVRDRTQEFHATVDSFQSFSSNASNTQSNNNKNTIKNNSHSLSKDSIDQSNRLHNLANNISSNIDNVGYKIKELEECAALTSNFHDCRPKIQSLMITIKKDIDSLNNDLRTFKLSFLQSFSTLKSSNYIIKHYKSLLDILQSRYSCLAKSFGNACEISTKYLKKQKKERDKINIKNNNKKKYRTVALNRLSNRRHTNTNNNEQQPLLASSQMQLYQETQYNEQRVIESEHIEQQLTEISTMMGKLANMVDEQRHTLLSIGDNVDDSIQHVEGAIEQLQKYLSSLSGNRWLIIKVFALLIFLAIIFTVFIA